MTERTKKLTDATYSPEPPSNEAAIRSQIDGSIQEVLDLALADTTVRKLSTTGDFTGTINGGDPKLTEPGLSAAFDKHLSESAVHVKDYGAIGNANYLHTDGLYYTDSSHTVLSHDDTNNINLALAVAALTKRPIDFGTGFYLRKSKITLLDNTIPSLGGNGVGACGIMYDLEEGLAIETQSYYTRAIVLHNIEFRLKDPTKTVSGLKTTCPDGWGAGIIATNVNFTFFTGTTIDATEAYNPQFENCRIMGKILETNRVGTLLQINKGATFSNLISFKNCTFHYGKISIQNKGGSPCIFSHCGFESQSLFLNVTQVPGLTTNMVFDTCWYEKVDKGIINSDINEDTLEPIFPLSNYTPISGIHFRNCTGSIGVATPFLNSVVEPVLYQQFSMIDGVESAFKSTPYKAVTTFSNGAANTVTTNVLMTEYFNLAPIAYEPTQSVKYGSMIVVVEASGYLGAKMQAVFVTSNYQTDCVLQGTVHDLGLIGSDYKIRGIWSDSLTLAIQVYAKGLTDVKVSCTFFEI
jgi:hypothetical protein